MRTWKGLARGRGKGLANAFENRRFENRRFENRLGAAIGLSATALLAAAEKPRPPARPAPAPASAAERYSAPTSYRTLPGHGYSARDRHMADCLATYRSYNPDTDHYVVRPGVTRRCEF